MKPLNYHHLYYFYCVATEGHLGRMAEMLNLSQSALSIQIRNLEERLGQPLFDHAGRKLTLTEAGRIALDHATRIFGAGDELLATLRHTGAGPQRLRVGGLSTLSRNFQLQFLRPALALGTYPVVLKSGTMPSLLADLKALALDVVLTTELPPGGTDSPFAAQRIDDQTIGLHGRPTLLAHDTLQDLLANAPLILPTDNVIQTGFENLIQKLDVQPISWPMSTIWRWCAFWPVTGPAWPCRPRSCWPTK